MVESREEQKTSSANDAIENANAILAANNQYLEEAKAR